MNNSGAVICICTHLYSIIHCCAIEEIKRERKSTLFNILLRRFKLYFPLFPAQSHINLTFLLIKKIHDNNFYSKLHLPLLPHLLLPRVITTVLQPVLWAWAWGRDPKGEGAEARAGTATHHDLHNYVSRPSQPPPSPPRSSNNSKSRSRYQELQQNPSSRLSLTDEGRQEG